ncbi:glycosyltransferase family protein [Candidatus Gribaldobacteria bacterium]|nr:glycosyltransferase family protein [Candidatus Gribaldobacteria bacterium]
MVTAIVQARTTSSRLPNKVLMNLEEKPMVLRVLQKVKKAKQIKQIILAIPEGRDNDPLEYFAKENKIICYRGSENDVLSRYYEAAKQFEAKTIIRITADCPFIDPKIIDQVIRAHKLSKADYTSNVLERTFPRGLDVEVFSFKALEKAYFEAEGNYRREHVTPYFFENPNLFKLCHVKAKKELNRPELRLTVDTKEDFELTEKVYHHFKNKTFKTIDVIKYLDSRPELKQLNDHIFQKPLNC